MTCTDVKERPILMHARSINGILKGRKTQTRRIMKQQPSVTSKSDGLWPDEKAQFVRNRAQYIRDCCPYGQPGDRLWARETWGGDDLCGFAYRADHPDWPRFQGDGEQPDSKWKPSIHMPRKASRLSLEITGIRVERVQDISEADAKSEGCQAADYATGRECILDPSMGSYRLHFQSLWDDTNGKGAWDRNDWCWVVDFKRIAQ